MQFLSSREVLPACINEEIGLLHLFQALIAVFFCGLLSPQAAFATSDRASFDRARQVLNASEKPPVAQNIPKSDVFESSQPQFGPQMPDAMKIEVNLEEINDQKVQESYEMLGNSSFKPELELDLRRMGMAATFSLWGSGHKEIKRRIHEILERGLNEYDPKNISITVNSKLLPMINAFVIDANGQVNERRLARYNEEMKLYEQEKLEYDLMFDSKVAFPKLPPVKPKLLPKNEYLKISISLGMMASVKTVDELAGQIYKAVSRSAPEVYGYKEDRRFLELKNTLTLLDQAFGKREETKATKNHESYRLQKNRMWSELAAMERLLEAGYNIWALYNYEDRMNRWVQDVYQVSKSHRLNRQFNMPLESSVNPFKFYYNELGKDKMSKYMNIKDSQFAYRLQLLFSYVGYLQGAERGGERVNTSSTKFSFSTKRMQWGMKLYMTSIFSGGLYTQVPTLVMGMGTIITAIAFPHKIHAAYSAVTNTMQGAWQGSYLQGVSTTASDKIGSLTSKVMNITNEYLENSYLGAHLSEFMRANLIEYHHMLFAGASIIGSYYLVKNLPQLADYYREYSKQVRDSSGRGVRENLDAFYENHEKEKDNQSFAERHGIENTSEFKEVFKRNTRVDQRFFMGVIESAVEVSTHLVMKRTKPKEEFSTSEAHPKNPNTITETENSKPSWKSIRKVTALAVATSQKIFKQEGQAFWGTLSSVPRAGLSFGISLKKRSGQIIVYGPKKFGAKTLQVLDEIKNKKIYNLHSYAKKIDNAEKRGKNKEVIAAEKSLLESYQRILDAPKNASSEDFQKIWQEVVSAAVAGESKAHVKSIENHFIKLSMAFKEYVESGKANLNDIGAYFSVWVIFTQIEKYYNKSLYNKFKTLYDMNYNYPYARLSNLKTENHYIFSVFASISNWLDKHQLLLNSIKLEGLHSESRIKDVVELEFINVEQSRESIQKFTYPHSVVDGRLDFSDPYDFNVYYFQHKENFKGLIYFFDQYLPLVRYFSRYIELGRRLNQLSAEEMKEFLEISSISNKGRADEIEFYFKKMYQRFVPGNRYFLLKNIMEQNVSFDKKLDYLVGVFYEIRNFELHGKLPPKGKESFLTALDRYLKNIPYNEQFFVLHALSTEAERKYESKSIFKKLLKRKIQRSNQLSAYLTGKSKGIRDFIVTVERFYDSPYANVNEPYFNQQVSKVVLDTVLRRPSLIRSIEEFNLLFEYEKFWSENAETVKSTAVETPILQLFESKEARIEGKNIAASYSPVRSLEIHQMAMERYRELVGKSFSEMDINNKAIFWEQISSRGVSTISDALLSEILAEAPTELERSLKSVAVDEGRVLDQKVKDHYALEELYRSSEYITLMQTKLDQENRSGIIEDLVKAAQKAFKHMGTAYEDFLEETSWKMKANESEAFLLNKFKTESLTHDLAEKYAEGNKELDERVAAFSKILPYIKKWTKEQQKKFVLFLRGSLSADDFPFVKKQFPIYGPERIRRMYQELSVAKRTAILSLYLKETLLTKGTIYKGHAKQLLDTIIDEARDQEAKRYAKELVGALLKGIEKAGNDPFQLVVLSALSAMDSQKEGSVGETIKVILEQFPGVGPKIAQFLIPTNVLSEDINTVLRTAQDGTLPPTHLEMYEDAERILKGPGVPFRIIKSLGSGSMKYTYLAEYLSSGDQMVMQVFREDIQYNSKLYIDILRQTVASLISKDAKRWSFLEVVVEGAVSAVEKEKRYSREAAKNSIAMHRVYRSFSDTNFVVEVPTQEQLRSRFLSADLALGENFFKLEAYDKVMTGIKIMEMEADILFSDKDVIWYDTDRHAGNYLIEKLEKSIGPQYKISPIDFGQLTFIRKQQRENVLRLFSLAKIASMYGANPWLNNEIAELLQLDKNETKQLKKRMNSFFDGPRNLKDLKKTPVLTYYELLSVINKSVKRDRSDSNFSGGKLRNAYADFVRAIVQFNQYQNELEKVAPEVMKNLEFRSPISILADSLSTQMEQDLKNIRFTGWQRAKAGLVDAYRWVKAKTSQSEYVKLNLRVSKEEIEGFTALAEKERLSEQKTKVQRLSKHESKTALDALLKDRVTDPRSCKVAL